MQTSLQKYYSEGNGTRCLPFFLKMPRRVFDTKYGCFASKVPMFLFSEKGVAVNRIPNILRIVTLLATSFPHEYSYFPVVQKPLLQCFICHRRGLHLMWRFPLPSTLHTPSDNQHGRLENNIGKTAHSPLFCAYILLILP